MVELSDERTNRVHFNDEEEDAEIEDQNADVIFSIDGDEFLAHSNIVSRSEYFNRILLTGKEEKMSDENGTLVVRISSDVVTYRSFKAIMGYLYTGNVRFALSSGNIPRSSIEFLIEVWSAARLFEMSEISQRALEILRTRINKKSAASILDASLEINPPLWELGQESFEYIVKYASLMLKNSEEKIECSLKNAKSVVRYLNRIMTEKTLPEGKEDAGEEVESRSDLGK